MTTLRNNSALDMDLIGDWIGWNPFAESKT
jgi:hypothetical protein